MRSLRRRKLVPRRLADAVNEDEADYSKAAYRPPPKSPHSGSDSEGECAVRNQRGGAADITKSLKEQPMFSLKHVRPVFAATVSGESVRESNLFELQVQMIVQRLLSEQEMRLRNEYEVVLNTKLDG